MTDKLPFSLTGKIAAVTGFGSPADELSNGSAIARLFARQGAVIEGLDINAKDAQTTIKAIQAEGGQAFSPLVMLQMNRPSITGCRPF